MALLTPFTDFSFHSHQVEAITWMRSREASDAAFLRGGILADEMGLGKTWTTIGLLLNEPVAHTLLLVPSVLQQQWSEALLKSGIAHRMLRGAKKDGSGLWTRLAGRRDGLYVTLCTYDRAAYNVGIICADTYQRIVADEGHVLRNGKATVRFAKTIQIPAERRWILSGTPVQNSQRDFHNLVEWLGMECEERIRIQTKRLAEELILRRVVSDIRAAVSDMPILPTYRVHAASMPEESEEHSVLQALVGRFEHAVESGASQAIVLELYLRIQQFLAHPSVYVDAMVRKFGSTYKRASWNATTTKFTAFRKWLETEPLEPTIVFTQFRLHMDLVAAQMETAGYTVFRICGGLSESARTEAIAASRKCAEEGKPCAILVQIVAGSAGLNLQHCARVVFLTSHWNPTVMDQAVARAYRMGQSKQVVVHHFLLPDNAERNIDRLMVGRHGLKRTIAKEIHQKLYCEAAPSSELVIQLLNDALPEVVTVVTGDEDPVDV